MDWQMGARRVGLFSFEIPIVHSRLLIPVFCRCAQGGGDGVMGLKSL